MITLDGSLGEGGGQILRSALSLSLLAGQPFKIINIRAGREKPGLLRQHLTAVQAATEIGSARVSGAEIGSRELTFEPGKVAPGNYSFAVGTAGSATLVLQTILPPLLAAGAPSQLRLEGGTHNPFAPPFDFLAKAFLPQLEKMGARADARLIRPGFYPAGGGEFSVSIAPVAKLSPLHIKERGEIRSTTVVARVAGLPRSIGQREIDVVASKLGIEKRHCRVEEIDGAHGPGNIVIIVIDCEHVTEVFTGFGEKRVSAESVAERAASAARDYLATSVPVGTHLADQLLLPLAMAGAGSFRTVAPTPHTTTNMEIIQKFLSVRIRSEKVGEGIWEITVSS
jgi:RNA 3'-terminal phosphate cyclase (ATP)